MTAELTTEPKKETKALSKPAAFRQTALNFATMVLTDWVGEDRAREAAGRISVALSAARSSSKKPEDFDECLSTPQGQESVGRVIAIAALTGMMPSTGAGALAFAIPRSVRRGEPKQLFFQLSHRGLNALANRAGMHMVATPIGYDDKIKIGADGTCEIESIDFDNPPISFDDLRGVVLAVKIRDTGTVIHTGFVAKKLIEKRRANSDGYNYAEKPGNDFAKDSDPWHKWPIEQSMKTAMHYAIGRGWCVIDDTESVRALQADIQSDTRTIDAEYVKRVTLQKVDLPAIEGPAE